MGLYTELDCDDFYEQVKCFFSPCYPLDVLSEDPEDVKLVLYCSGGKLDFINKGEEVPYVTEFYNYGKDFIIFDYRIFKEDEIKNAIIIKDGKLHKIVPYNEITKEDILPLVIDNYGEIIKVETVEDFTSITRETFEAYTHYKKHQIEELEKLNIPNAMSGTFMRDFREGKYSSKEFARILAENDRISNEASELFLVSNRQKWYYNETEELYQKVHGGYKIGILLNLLKDKTFVQFEKHLIIKKYIELLTDNHSDFDTEMENYFQWCEKSNTNVNKEEVWSMIEGAKRLPTKQERMEYVESQHFKNSVMRIKKPLDINKLPHN